MENRTPFHHDVSRRALLAGGAGAALLGVVNPGTAAALVRPDRPLLTHGVQSGDVTSTSGLVWTRSDRPARMIVEVSPDPSFRFKRTVAGPWLTPDTDGTGQVRINGLLPGSQVHYRVRAEGDRGGSEPVVGSFRTTPLVFDRQDVRFLWSGDTVGQGWGSNPDLGGMRIFSAMADRNPHFFVHSGDTVYADGPLTETVTLPDGRVWRNVVTPEKTKVAETLAEYRGQYAYNLLDANYRRFNSLVPQYNQWDDHEVRNNWYPGQILTDDRYTEKNVDVLAERAFQAFHEWVPLDPWKAEDGRVYRKFRYGRHLEIFLLDMRTYRDRNSPGDKPYERILGDKQARWLANEVADSSATWKIIASDMPLGVVVPDGKDIEAVANGKPGVPTGREAEIAWVLDQWNRRGVRNTVWLTADVHYSAAHHYDPSRAAVQNFHPFWEFVSGPLNAGAFGPNALDSTFGPKVEFVHAPPAPNSSPLDGFQHFGEIDVRGATGELTVNLRNAAGVSLWNRTLKPER
ncbi:alkaline phosphatase [Pseudonocardiaceae bacterium YIM PH 21723]|nr:alkaline phosphatase [Pseudonocardiaceae bacterium YIM PH 21723]